MNKIAYAVVIFFLISCNFITEDDRDDFVGEYIFNVKNSDISNYEDEHEFIKTLQLKILDNDSFYFSHDVPFFEKISGKVEYRSIDGFAICYLVYYEVEGVKLEEQVGRDEYGNLYITNTRSKDGAANISKAYFTRIR
jgi:hypothetical protein